MADAAAADVIRVRGLNLREDGRHRRCGTACCQVAEHRAGRFNTTTRCEKVCL
jgi:hypothetical protein